MELIPGNEDNLDKKQFTWKLLNFDQKNMEIKIDFENPEYISFEDKDLMQISFFNTIAWLRSEEEDEEAAIPEGYSVEIILPP